jgi:hypothetical protein
MIDENLKPWIIEMNWKPNLGFITKMAKKNLAVGSSYTFAKKRNSNMEQSSKQVYVESELDKYLKCMVISDAMSLVTVRK